VCHLEIVAILSQEWHNVVLTESGAVYVATVLEYLTAEILELSGNSGYAQNSRCISPRNIQLAIKGDEELFQMFHDLVIREGGGPAVTGARMPIVDFENSATMAPLFGPDAKREDGNWAEDPLSGFAVYRYHNEMIRALDEFSRTETRQERKTKLLSECNYSDFTRELPMEATLATLEAVDIEAFHRRLEWHKLFANQSTQFCIERGHFRRLLREYCSRQGLNSVPTFTHEAMNVLQTAAENRLVEILSVADSLKADAVMVSAADIEKAEQSIELWLSCARNDIEGLTRSVELGASTMVMYRGCTPLIVACEHGCLEAARRLFEIGADSSHPTCSTALNVAIQRGQNEIMLLLLERGVPISGLFFPLLTAVQKRNVIAISELVRRGADVNVADTANNTVLHMVCATQSPEDLEIAEILICNGCDIELLDKGSRTALSLLKNESDRDRLVAVKQMVDNPSLK
jgi:histone H3/H4